MIVDSTIVDPCVLVMVGTNPSKARFIIFSDSFQIEGIFFVLDIDLVVFGVEMGIGR